MNATPSRTIRVARTAEIPEGKGREFKVGERYIAIFCSEGHFSPSKMTVRTQERP